MNKSELQIGDKVTAIYKTGKYIGEVTGVSDRFYLVKIAAVIKHPMQGDLHHPKQVDVQMFHARKALSYREQANVPKNMVKPYADDIPAYEESLKSAFEHMKSALSADETEWNKKSLEALEELEKDYFKK